MARHEMIELFKPNTQEGYAPMTRRLATMCLMTVFSTGLTSLYVRAQDTVRTRTSLKGIGTVWVLVETLPEGAKTLGLTKEDIQNDVELKLRLAGMRVVVPDEGYKLPGSPSVYVQVNLTNTARAAHIRVELDQSVWLARNDDPQVSVATWGTSILLLNPTPKDIRDDIKDKVGVFLNAWLSVNPKK